MEELKESIKETFEKAFKESVLHNKMGFDYDRWNDTFKLKNGIHHSNNQVANAIKKYAMKSAESLCEGIDFKAIPLSNDDKKAIIAAYKKARREKLEEAAFEAATQDIDNFIDETIKKVRDKVVSRSKDKPSKVQKEILDLVFGQ